MKKVFLGLSGGVDSSVAALLLKKQGYQVTGVFMKNWSQNLPGMKCPWAEDLADAKRVAVRLGLDFQVFDFEKDYKQKVVDYMITEYQKGNTPNPDIMCNQEIKFKLFADLAFEQGADLIATGHYAKSLDGQLLRAVDANKDQTYFLYRVRSEVLRKTIFPLGDLMKSEVRELALAAGLHNAKKSESMGVCFVGEANMKDFLSQYIETRPGKIIELETGKILGYHDGAIFYTIGQRHGLGLAQGLPYYVVKKDMPQNLIYVSRDLNAANLWLHQMQLKDDFFRIAPQGPIMVRLRHRAPLVEAKYQQDKHLLQFKEAQKAIAAGQSVVFYGGDDFRICLGGAIVA